MGWELSLLEYKITDYVIKTRVCVHSCLFHLVLHSYDYNVHVEDLLPAKLCLVTLFSLECFFLQFERFRLQLAHIVNKTSCFKTKLTGNNAEAS